MIINESKTSEGYGRRPAEYAGNDPSGTENAGGYGKITGWAWRVVDPEDIETLQDLIIAAVNEAIKTVDKLNSEEMNKVTAGLNVPGLM